MFQDTTPSDSEWLQFKRENIIWPRITNLGRAKYIKSLYRPNNILNQDDYDCHNEM